MISNKYKQLYECRLPAQAVRFHQDPASEPDSQGYTGPDIPELLSPMHDAQCLVKVGCFAASRLSETKVLCIKFGYQCNKTRIVIGSISL